MLPNKLRTFKEIKDKYTTVLYIHHEETTDIDKTRGYISIVREDDKNVFIDDLYVNYKNRKLGIGTFLLLNACYLNLDKTISLDDMSNNYNKKNNIYAKLGFKYVSPDMDPEMKTTCKEVFNHYESFLKKYKDNGFFV